MKGTELGNNMQITKHIHTLPTFNQFFPTLLSENSLQLYKHGVLLFYVLHFSLIILFFCCYY